MDFPFSETTSPRRENSNRYSPDEATCLRAHGLAKARVRTARELAFLVREHDLDATIGLTARRRVIASDREALALAHRLDAIALDTTRGERVLHRQRTVARQLEVVFLGAHAVRMAFDHHLRIRVLVHELGQAIHHAARTGFQRRLAGVEQHVTER